MEKDPYAIALKNALTEIRNINPDINYSFLFNKNGKIIAGDAETPETIMKDALVPFENILDKTDAIGGLHSIIIDGLRGQVHISLIEDMYLALVTSKNADINYLQTVTRAIIPTVLKLLKNMSYVPVPPTPIKEEKEEKIEEEPEEKEKPKEKIAKEQPFDIKPDELLLPPSNQLIVDIVGGLLVRSDTAQVDPDILTKWSEHLSEEKINEIEIETFNGKTLQCKVKAIGDSKYHGKGIIRIPEKIRRTLDVKKGELVRVRPVVL